MSSSFVVVPQWQGSGSSRAMRLVDGADAIRGDLPASATHIVGVPLEAGDERETGISRFSSLALVHERMLDVLRELDDTPIIIGGDCGVELAGVESAIERTGGDVAVVWFDAHPDLHNPESSESHAFSGMVLRAILGDSVDGLLPVAPLAASRVVLAGIRAVDDAEDAYLEGSDIVTVGVNALDTPDELVAAIAATGASSVYIHIDVDVLDPAEFSGKGDPVPFGVTPAQLVALIRAVRARFTLAGAGITEFAPSSADGIVDDMPTVLRLIGALTAP